MDKKLKVYKCIKCGDYKVSKFDGQMCSCCNGTMQAIGELKPFGDENNKNLNISLKDTEIFEKMLQVFLSLMEDDKTPEWIKFKIKKYALDIINK